MADPKDDDLTKVSPLLGTRAAQAAVDGLAKNVTRLSESLNKVTSGMDRVHRATGGGKWNSASNWSSGKPNGGVSAWDRAFLGAGGGVPPTGQQTNGKPNGGGGFWSGFRTGAQQGMSGQGGGGFLSGLGGAITFSGMAAFSDRVATNTTAQMLSRSSTMPWAQVSGSFMTNNYTAMNNVDAAQGAATLGAMGYSAGSRQWNAQMGYQRTFGRIDPSLSAQQVANAQYGIGSGQLHNYLMGRGINTIGGAAGRMTPAEMAHAIFNRTTSYRGRLTKANVAWYTSQSGAGGVALDSMVRSGQMDSDTAAAIRSEMNAQNTANSNGFSYEQYARARANDDTAMLKKMGINPTDANRLKEQEAARRNVQQNTVEGFSKGLEHATDLLVGFNKILETITNGPIGKGVGYGQGFMGSLATSTGTGIGMGLGGRAVGRAIAGRVAGSAATTAATTGAEGGALSLLGTGAATTAAGVAAPLAVAGASIYYGNKVKQASLGALNEVHKADPYSAQNAVKRLDPSLFAAVGDNTAAPGLGGDTPLTQTGKTGKSGNRVVSLLKPANGPITSKFGPRPSPGGIGSRNHQGIDIGVKVGTPVVAAANGTVTAVSYNSISGNFVMVDHGNGLVTRYQHLSSASVRTGAKVNRGSRIASSGNTGTSTGPHLHFEVHRNGTPVDPMPYLGGGGMVGSASTSSIEGSKGDTSAAASTPTSKGGGINAPGGTSEAALVAAALGGTLSAAGGSRGAGGQSTGAAAGSGGGSPSGSMPKGNVASWIKQALGVLNLDYSKYGSALATIIQHESGGNPRAINKWDSNWKAGHPSKGLMQTIDTTFNAYKLPGHGDIWNPVDNIIAATRYALSRYGSMDNVPGIKSLNNGGGYKGYRVGSTNIDVDQVARVHKGEMVLDEASAEQLRQLLQGNNSTKGLLGGGGSKVVLTFGPGSVVLQASGPMTDSQATEFAQKFVRTLANESAVLQIAEG